jgi:hypothetical protein
VEVRPVEVRLAKVRPGGEVSPPKVRPAEICQRSSPPNQIGRPRTRSLTTICSDCILF